MEALLSRQAGQKPSGLPRVSPYKVVLPAFFAFLHLALAIAASLAFAAGLILRFGFAPAVPFAAHRFRTPARMLASPCALSFRRLRGCSFGASASPPSSWVSSLWSVAMRSWRSAARRRACGETVRRLFMLVRVATRACKSRTEQGGDAPRNVPEGAGIRF